MFWVKSENFVKAIKDAHRKAGHNDSCPVFCVTVWDDLYEETVRRANKDAALIRIRSGTA